MPHTNPNIALVPTPKELKDREDNLGRILRRCLGFLTVLVLCVAAFSHFVSPTLFVIYQTVYFFWALSLLIESAVYFRRGRRLINDYAQIDWDRKCKELTGEPLRVYNSLVHLIVLPNYKESIETLTDTMQILSEHTMAKEKYVVCLAMEEAEVNCKTKADELVAKFQGYFLQVLVTVHPKNLPGESRGKAPNVSWAVETSKKTLCAHNMDDILVTVCDADTHFINDYFACVSYKHSTTTDRAKVVWGIPISFYQNALDVPAPVRVTDMVWAITVLQQLSTGRSVRFPCSTYSLTMDLANCVGFWDKGPEAIGEDAHMFLKVLFKTSGEARIETVYVPAGCYNVCDDTWIGSIKARYNQMYRHLWGTFDLAYIVQQTVIMKDMSFSRAMLAFYEMFKVRVLPPTMTFSIAVMPNLLKWYYPVYSTYPYNLAMFCLASFQLFCIVPYVAMAIYYEFLHRGIVNQAIARGTGLPQHKRTAYHFFVDWLIFPVISVLFYTVCSLHVQWNQFFTDSLSYEVAPKPAAHVPSGLKPLEEVVVAPTQPQVNKKFF